MTSSNAFWIIGTIFNVTMTALCIWWLLKQTRKD